MSPRQHSPAPADPPGSTNFICGAAATYCDSSSLCPDYWLGDGYCDAVCNNAECGYDGGQDTGDCAVTDLLANDPCILAGCPSTALMGNGVCDADCDIPACYNDGGDCLNFTAAECSPGCPTSWIGDGICDTACQTSECSDDAGDCTTSGIAAPSAVALYSSCTPGCPTSWIGDGICDEVCRSVPACSFDCSEGLEDASASCPSCNSNQCSTWEDAARPECAECIACAQEILSCDCSSSNSGASTSGFPFATPLPGQDIGAFGEAPYCDVDCLWDWVDDGFCDAACSSSAACTNDGSDCSLVSGGSTCTDSAQCESGYCSFASASVPPAAYSYPPSPAPPMATGNRRLSHQTGVCVYYELAWYDKLTAAEVGSSGGACGCTVPYPCLASDGTCVGTGIASSYVDMDSVYYSCYGSETPCLAGVVMTGYTPTYTPDPTLCSCEPPWPCSVTVESLDANAYVGDCFGSGVYSDYATVTGMITSCSADTAISLTACKAGTLTPSWSGAEEYYHSDKGVWMTTAPTVETVDVVATWADTSFKVADTISGLPEDFQLCTWTALDGGLAASCDLPSICPSTCVTVADLQDSACYTCKLCIESFAATLGDAFNPCNCPLICDKACLDGAGLPLPTAECVSCAECYGSTNIDAVTSLSQLSANAVLSAISATSSEEERLAFAEVIDGVATNNGSGWSSVQLSEWSTFYAQLAMGLPKSLTDWEVMLATLGYMLDYTSSKLTLPALSSATYDGYKFRLTFATQLVENATDQGELARAGKVLRGHHQEAAPVDLLDICVAHAKMRMTFCYLKSGHRDKSR